MHAEESASTAAAVVTAAAVAVAAALVDVANVVEIFTEDGMVEEAAAELSARELLEVFTAPVVVVFTAASEVGTAPAAPVT